MADDVREAAILRLQAVAEGRLVPNPGGGASISDDVALLLSLVPVEGIAAQSSPPADDVREEAERRWPVKVIGYTDSDGSRFEYESTENRHLREAFIAGASFEVRPYGTVPAEQISDAEVEAAQVVYQNFPGDHVERSSRGWQMSRMRAALEAAREAK